MDKLINYGGAVKALGDGRVSGYLVVFGDAENTDVTGLRDFFTPDTDFCIGEEAKTAVWYRHGLNPELDRQIGEGSLKVDDVGVFIDAQLNLRDRYVKAVYGEMATKGKLGWSSGSAKHLIRREAQENGAHKIIRWPLGIDASVTPDPAEPRTAVVTEMKCLEEAADPLDAEILPALKSQFLGEYVERDMTIAALERLNSSLMYSVVYQCLFDESLTTEQKRERLAGAFGEFSQIALDTLSAYFGKGEDAAEAMKALRTLWGPARPESLTEHSAKAVSAVTDFADRLESRLEARKTDGRTLSAPQVDALKSALTALGEVEAVKTRLTRALADAEPVAQDTALPVRDLQHERDLLRSRVLADLALTGCYGRN